MLLLEAELGLVLDVLPLASTTHTEVFTARLRSQRGRLSDRKDLCLRIALLDLLDPSVDDIPRHRALYKDHKAIYAGNCLPLESRTLNSQLKLITAVQHCTSLFTFLPASIAPVPSCRAARIGSLVVKRLCHSPPPALASDRLPSTVRNRTITPTSSSSTCSASSSSSTAGRFHPEARRCS